MTLKSAADKLYDLITVSQELGNERIRQFWNLENRIYAVNKFVGLIGTLNDTNPVHKTDLETLASCVQKLEEKYKTRHWQKACSNSKRKITHKHINDTIASLKSYIGTEALKQGKRYDSHSNEIIAEYAETQQTKQTIDNIAYA